MNNTEVLIDIALREDLADIGDVTSLALIDPDLTRTISMVTREAGVFSGEDVVKTVLSKVDSSLDIDFLVSDGDELYPGTAIANINGNLQSILRAERLVLNFVQHLSGIASATRKCVELLSSTGSKTKVRDTRKTLPGYRALEKKAVIHGGGVNHRMGLYDAFLVKDNHLAGATISEVVEKCRSFDPDLAVEVEVDNLEQLKIVVQSKPDLILLDNFSPADVLLAKEISSGIDLEISGGVNVENIVEYGSTNVTYIAIGSITHSVKAMDIGFDYEQ